MLQSECTQLQAALSSDVKALLYSTLNAAPELVADRKASASASNTSRQLHPCRPQWTAPPPPPPPPGPPGLHITLLWLQDIVSRV